MNDSKVMSLFPESNSVCAGYIYVVEVALRELIVEELSRIDGPSWYKSAMPGGEIMKKYQESRKYQRETPWAQAVPLHPVYYLDFPDLVTLIERRNNWCSCFEKVFSSRKDTFISSLRSLEPIRNALAHNRKITSNTIIIVRGVANLLASSLGEERLEFLVRKCTDATGVSECLGSLRGEIEAIKNCIHNAHPLPPCPQLDSTKQAWWFDSDYLETDLKPLHEFINLVAGYANLPRGRGVGHVVERWIKDKRFNAITLGSLSVIDALLKEHRE